MAFSITLSPTYAVPVLWFGARDIRSLDDLYRILVPQHLRGAVADVSVLGGITQAVSMGPFSAAARADFEQYHPVTGMPSYFVHPCNTHQALQALNSGQLLTPEAYLILWLGIVGAAVGLHVPSCLVASKEWSQARAS